VICAIKCLKNYWEQSSDPENWMPVEIIANEPVKAIETPIQAEISKTIINRK
jgi:hypothetical protein